MLPVLLTVDIVPPGLTAKFWTCCTQIFDTDIFLKQLRRSQTWFGRMNHYIHKKECAELNCYSPQGSTGLSNLFFYTDWLQSKTDLETMQMDKVINIIKHGHAKPSFLLTSWCTGEEVKQIQIKLHATVKDQHLCIPKEFNLWNFSYKTRCTLFQLKLHSL